jgi:hypothetical protein
MIRLFLNGGLGNQLFEYAAARAVGIRTGTSLEIDLRFYNAAMTGTPKGPWLTDLPVNATFKRYEMAWVSPHNPLKRGFEKLVLERFREIYIDTELGFNQRVLTLGPNAVMIGYFQCYKYFEHQWASMSHELDMAPFADHAWLNAQEHLGQPWCAVHVRRGDYVGDPRFEMKAPERYYGRAIELVKNREPRTRFVVFSDGEDWCRRQAWLEGCEFYTGSEGRHPAADLATMARASSNIIANSSYSWWAAWTGQHRGKVIVAPSMWLEGHPTAETEIVPNHWLIV